tara:strand:+ start:3181 stop:3750 length:570 start_codon:yes stop_codon:yes gene_type:complete
MATGTVTRGLIKMAGSTLGGFLDDALKIGGKVGQAGATAALDYGKGKFAPQLAGKVGKEIPELLRSSPTSTIPKAGKLLGQGAVLGGLFGLSTLADQQSEHTQPISQGSTGNSDVDKFLMSQQLQNQKFMHDMAMVQARAESRIPGRQYGGGSLSDAAKAEQLMTEAGEVTNREVKDIARMIYGTGLRA